MNQRVYSCLGAGHSVGHLGNLLWIYPESYSEKLSFDYWINGRRVGSSARWEGPTTSFSAVKWWLPMAWAQKPGPRCLPDDALSECQQQRVDQSQPVLWVDQRLLFGDSHRCLFGPSTPLLPSAGPSHPGFWVCPISVLPLGISHRSPSTRGGALPPVNVEMVSEPSGVCQVFAKVMVQTTSNSPGWGCAFRSWR